MQFNILQVLRTPHNANNYTAWPIVPRPSSKQQRPPHSSAALGIRLAVRPAFSPPPPPPPPPIACTNTYRTCVRGLLCVDVLIQHGTAAHFAVKCTRHHCFTLGAAELKPGGTFCGCGSVCVEEGRPIRRRQWRKSSGGARLCVCGNVLISFADRMSDFFVRACVRMLRVCVWVCACTSGADLNAFNMG